MLEQLTIFEKTYQLVLWLYPTIQKFPKSQRFVLGQQIENVSLDVLRGIIRASAANSRGLLVSLAKRLGDPRIGARPASDG